MPKTRAAQPVSDGAENFLHNLISDFSYDNAKKWLHRKFSSFDTSSERDIPIEPTKNNRTYFAGVRHLGYVRTLNLDSASNENKPLPVIAVHMKKSISERTSRSVQFNLARTLLKNEVEHSDIDLTGLPAQGIFFFHDDEGCFRISLVSGEIVNRRFQFNAAKRQSFFIDPDLQNNIVKRRLNPAIPTFDALKKAFSVEALTREFYDALFRWYQWAMDPATGITFPNDTSTHDDDRFRLSEAMIRLITRLMFVWFIRQKGIVPQQLFDSAELGDIVKNIAPDSMEQDNYYRVILQNLFFATLNCPPRNRKFQGNYHGMSHQRGIKTCYRYRDELVSPNDFLDCMKNVPFLNCALFDCLDRTDRPQDGGREILLDGFSSKPDKRAHIPNGLFFDHDRGIVNLFNLYDFTVDENAADDSDVALDPELLGKVFENLLGAFNPETQETARNATGSFYTPREIVDYMVEESLRNYLKTKTTFADDSRLDDLFDKTKAAENAPTPFNPKETDALLDALYNCRILDPACGSGAFPMGVLHCMVRLLARLDPNNIKQRAKLSQRYKDDLAELELDLSPKDLDERREALKKQFLESQTYPDYARKLYLIENCIYGVDIQPIATQISKLRFFISLLCDQLRSNWNPDADNYGLLSLPNLEAKFVCANTLIALPKVDGGDLALSTDGIQELKDKLRKNRHAIFCARTAETKAKYKDKDLDLRDQIRNLVHANLVTPDQNIIDSWQNVLDQALAERPAVASPNLVRRRETVGGDLFNPGVKQWVTVDLNEPERTRLDNLIRKAQRIIQEEQNKANASRAGTSAIDDLAAQVAAWDPYDQNASSPFFDPEWMFNVKTGFDIVIGNPPYIQLQANRGELAQIYQNCGFTTFARTGDIYSLFYERGFRFLADRGLLCFITSNKWMRAGYGEATRKFFAEETNPLVLIDFSGQQIFESATVDTNILLLAGEPNAGSTRACQIKTAQHEGLAQFIRRNQVICNFNYSDSWVVLSPVEQSVKRKVVSAGVPLENWNIQIYRGILTGCNEAFIVSAEKRGEILANCRSDAERRRTEEIIRPILRGRDVKRYTYAQANLYLIATHNGLPEENIPHIDINKYPALKMHLDCYWSKISTRTDRGNTPYNLRSCAYYGEFSKPKIIYPNMTKYMPFYYDTENFTTNQKCFIITGPHLAYLTAFFNSCLFKFCFRDNFPRLGKDGRELSKIFFDKIPVKDVSEAEARKYEELVLQIQSNCPDSRELEDRVDDMIFDFYGITQEERSYIRQSEEAFLAGTDSEEPEPEAAVATASRRRGRTGAARSGAGRTVADDDDNYLD